MSVAIKDVTFSIEGKGELKLHFGQRLFMLNNTIQCNLNYNLLLGPQLDRNGVEFHGGCSEVKLWQGDEYLFSAFKKNLQA